MSVSHEVNTNDGKNNSAGKVVKLDNPDSTLAITRTSQCSTHSHFIRTITWAKSKVWNYFAFEVDDNIIRSYFAKSQITILK